MDVICKSTLLSCRTFRMYYNTTMFTNGIRFQRYKIENKSLRLKQKQLNFIFKPLDSFVWNDPKMNSKYMNNVSVSRYFLIIDFCCNYTYRCELPSMDESEVDWSVRKQHKQTPEATYVTQTVHPNRQWSQDRTPRNWSLKIEIRIILLDKENATPWSSVNYYYLEKKTKGSQFFSIISLKMYKGLYGGYHCNVWWPPTIRICTTVHSLFRIASWQAGNIWQDSGIHQLLLKKNITSFVF